MFQGVHHIHYVIRDRDEMVKFLEKNFDLKPDSVEDNLKGHNPASEALYTVGKTQLQFTQPLGTTSVLAKHLADKGPGVFHVALEVDDLRGLAKKLKANGVPLRGQDADGINHSPRGGMNTNIDPPDGLGLWFQLAQDE